MARITKDNIVKAQFIADINTPLIFTGCIVNDKYVFELRTGSDLEKAVNEWVEDGNEILPPYTAQEMKDNQRAFYFSEMDNTVDKLIATQVQKHDTEQLTNFKTFSECLVYESTNTMSEYQEFFDRLIKYSSALHKSLILRKRDIVENDSRFLTEDEFKASLDSF